MSSLRRIESIVVVTFNVLCYYYPLVACDSTNEVTALATELPEDSKPIVHNRVVKTLKVILLLIIHL
jgi:hypothetical protein